MKNKSKLLFLVFSLFLCTSCEKNSNDETFKYFRIRVNHYQQAVPSKFVYGIQENETIGSTDWVYKTLYIDGFNYEPGYIYDLEVMWLKQPDQSGINELRLKKIQAKTKVADDTGFEINLRASNTNLIHEKVVGNYQLLNKINIDCGSLCNALQQAMQSNVVNITATVTRQTDGSYHLKAIQPK